ncbi:MAG: hypothetical protein GY755_04905 [Chloroflexi bacterium]|nr:hypothetical protein [Chloroflexota bacterium]
MDAAIVWEGKKCEKQCSVCYGKKETHQDIKNLGGFFYQELINFLP